MFDHLLESSHRDDSNKWSHIGFGEEIGIIEIKLCTLSGALESVTDFCLHLTFLSHCHGIYAVDTPLVFDAFIVYFSEPVGEYKSDIYNVEQPTVSHRSKELYVKYVRCGREGATDPPEANKEVYRNYVKMLYR